MNQLMQVMHSGIKMVTNTIHLISTNPVATLGLELIGWGVTLIMIAPYINMTNVEYDDDRLEVDSYEVW